MQLLTKCFLTLAIIIFMINCSKNEIEYKESKIEDPYITYAKALEAFEKNDFFTQVKIFRS